MARGRQAAEQVVKQGSVFLTAELVQEFMDVFRQKTGDPKRRQVKLLKIFSEQLQGNSIGHVVL